VELLPRFGGEVRHHPPVPPPRDVPRWLSGQDGP
jgi:hypothetical protein